MKTIWIALMAVGLTAGGALGWVEELDQKLSAADSAWLDGSAADAAPMYEAILDGLPVEAEPIRATLVLRLARARMSSGDQEGGLAALRLLEDMAYVPEHHALSSAELQAVAAGRPHPGLQRTPIPEIGHVDRTLHVDARAQAGGTGTVEQPFATVNEAVLTARLLLRKARAPLAVEIVLAPGTYQQRTPIRLTRGDAGRLNAPVVIRSADRNDPAILSGGAMLTTWRSLDDPVLFDRLPEAAREKVRVCDLAAHGVDNIGPLVFGGFSSLRGEPGNHRFNTMPVPELFYDGVPQTMARWPNDSLVRIPVNEAPKEHVARFRGWAEEEDLWLYGYWQHDWADAYEKVSSVEQDGTIRIAPPANCYGFSRRKGCAINAVCELDQPGEWYLDTKRNRIIYWPPEDFDPRLCMLSSFGPMVEGDGSSFVQLRDLRIEYVRGDAVTFRDCSDVLMANVGIRNCSGLGIRIQGGNNHLVHSCRIESMGRGAIDLWSGDWRNLVLGNSTVENCHISGLSRIDRTYTPALVLEGMGLRVRHNEFEDIPSSAIRIEASDVLIELNHFRRCVYESGDQGAIDMWANPLYRGNVIRWNDFDSIINTEAHLGAAAVRHDDYMSGFMVYGNIMRKGSGRGVFGAIQYNQGIDNYAEGNLFVGWHKVFTGRAVGGEEWAKKISEHPRSARELEETDWRSAAWQAKYPMVRDLMRGDDNYNYLVGNLLLGPGAWGKVGRSIRVGNRRDDSPATGDTLGELKPHLLPWYPIPVDRIGPYR